MWINCYNQVQLVTCLQNKLAERVFGFKMVKKAIHTYKETYEKANEQFQ